MTPQLILASNSPRRKELLALTGWQFTVQPADIDESVLPGEAPDAYVLRLAESKARAVGHLVQPGQIILAADTTVADGMEILGKPADADEAHTMLLNLRGRMHMVYTAIGVFDTRSSRMITDLCGTRVWMRNYSDEEIVKYIASGDPFDKAGGYAIQHPGFHPVERIEGCYACVVGLPLCHVVRAAEQFGMRANQNVADACPQTLQMDTPCPETERILRSGGEGKEK